MNCYFRLTIVLIVLCLSLLTRANADGLQRESDMIEIISRDRFIGTVGTVIISPKLTNQQPNYIFDNEHGADVFRIESSVYDQIVRFLQDQAGNNKPCKEKASQIGPTNLLLFWTNGNASGGLCTSDDDTVSLLHGLARRTSSTNNELSSMTNKAIEKLDQLSKDSQNRDQTK